MAIGIEPERWEFGSDKAVTGPFCGAQVTPDHEHGV